MQPGIGSRTTHFTPGQAVTLSSYDNHTRVTIPADAASRPLTVTHTFDPASGEAAPPDQAGFREGFKTFYLNAYDESGAEFHQFSKPVTITMDYTAPQAQALGLPDADLTLFNFDETYNENAGGWLPVPTTVDSINHTVTASVNHFSDWQLSDGSSPSDAFVPSLQAGQVDLFRGSFSYSYPIEVPAGPGGMKPYLSLTYQSDESDTRKGERPKLQSNWVGKGWSLGPSYIALVKLDALPSLSRFYTLVLNGQSFDLVRGACRQGYTCTSGDAMKPNYWEWHTADESFMKIRAEVNTSTPPTPRGGTHRAGNTAYIRYLWQLWTNDGTRYDFEEDAWQGWFAPDSCQSPKCDPTDYTYLETYKWYLTRVEDTHGNRINYQYGDNTNGNGRLWASCDISVGNVHGTVQQDIWVTNITWGGNVNTGAPDRYRVNFDSWDRGSLDSSGDVPDNMCAAVKQTRQLRYLTVSTNHSSNPFNTSSWDQVRKYGLFYRDDVNDPHRTDPNYYLLSDKADTTPCNPTCTYTPDYSTTKLTLLKIVPWGNSTSALPSTTFEYNYGPSRGTGFFPTGGWNRLQYVDNGSGGRIQVQYENIGGTMGGLSGDSDFRGNHRVTTKTVYDAYGQSWGHSYAWTYDYHQSEAYNARSGPRHTTPTSASVWYNVNSTVSPALQLARRENREFRGHGDVTVHDPNGNETEHWFEQGNAGCTPTNNGNLFSDSCFMSIVNKEYVKGTEKQSISYQGATTGGTNSKLSENVNSFTIATALYPYISSLSLDDRKSGMWSSFHYEYQTVSRTWQNGSSLDKTTTYSYETTYGNLASRSDADGNGTLRTTEYGYSTCDNDSTNCPNGYIVNRKGWENVKDASGNWLKRIVYAYKPSLWGPGTPNSTADLTVQREFIFPISPATILTGSITVRDATYQYDTYGNQTKMTSYAGGGVVSVSGCPSNCQFNYGIPGGYHTTRETDTTYDTLYHDLPTQVEQPLVTGQSQRLAEQNVFDSVMRWQSTHTDYNGNTTSALYDSFGRLQKLVKQGDSTSEPSVLATYADYESPPRYMVYQKEAGSPSTYTYRIINQFYDGMGRSIQTKSESQDLAQNIVEDTIYDGVGQVTQQGQPRYVSQSGSAFSAYLPTSGQTIRWTTTAYDGAGRTRAIIAPDATTTWMTYTVASGLKSVLTGDANRHRTEHRSDIFGRLRQVVEYSGNCETGLCSEGNYTTYATTAYTYNPLDMLEQTTDTNSKSITMKYGLTMI